MEKAEIQALIREAFAAQKFAYVPYSHFHVGAALRGKNGQVFRGCNIENASYTPTNCAERTALFKAVSEGVREFDAIAIVGSKVGETNTLVTGPCGVCRQALYEFGGPELTVIMARSEDDYIVTTLGDLLPYGFGPANLEYNDSLGLPLRGAPAAAGEGWLGAARFTRSLPPTPPALRGHLPSRGGFFRKPKEFPYHMKKFLALLLTLALLAGLTACKDTEAASTAQEQHTVTAPTNDATFVYQPDDPAATLPGGESVVLVTGPGGTESGEDAMLWQGIQTFANTYGYTADAQTAAGNTADEAEAALRAAAESGAKLVVCRGDTMGAALYRMQENYPDVHYLLFDSEPHSDDYSAYNTASLVHCVLFQEEQAGYLAGYAAVTDGYTTLGFIGAREIPGIVRYCTGFLQGAEAAAELQGEYVTLQTWFTDTYENNDAITQRMIDWYNNGTSLIMVSGGNLYEGVSGAVNQTGGKAITTDYDNTELGDRVLGSAIKCYNAAVQRQLYTFFAAGTWNGQTGGQTEKAGFTNGEVALVAGAPWRFDSFTQDDYRTLYEDLRTSVLKMDAYSDLDTLPETPNVTVNRLL